MAIIQNGSELWTMSWPWPWMFSGSEFLGGLTRNGSALNGYMLVYVDGVGWVSGADVGELHDTYTEVEAISVADFGSAIVVGVLYVDSGKYNSKCYYTLPGTPSFTACDQVTTPPFSTCCNFKGQLVAAGFFQAGSRTNNDWDDLTGRSIAWSKIATLDFRINEDGNKTAGYSGRTSFKVGGSTDFEIIHNVSTLGEGVIVYCSTGTALLNPIIDPYPTFGLRELKTPGVLSKNCWAGDETVHGFIDTNYDFWIIDTSHEPRKLGYSEFLEPLFTSTAIPFQTVKVSYDPLEKIFYIANTSAGYALTQQGLYSTHQCLTSVARFKGIQPVGFWNDTADYEARITTDNLNYGQSSLKTVSVLEFDGKYKKTGEVASGSVQYCMGYSDDFADTVDLELNNQGICYPRITAKDFRAQLILPDYRGAEIKINRLVTRTQFGDKRSIRGQHNAG